ncbi:MAG TPA: hypothetical protein VFO77_05385, partial [Actinoplanes sp.]|nr:hypothetical protein [Actinoplanes sp.]
AVPVAPMAGDVPPAVEPPRRSNVTSLDAPVVSLDTRRAARDGSSDLGIGRRSSDAFDEVDERYLAALRGEAR